MSTQLSVLCLATDAYGGRGGIAQSCRDVVDALAALDQIERIELLPRQAPEPLTGIPEKVRQHRARAGRIAYSAATLRAAGRRPDIIFCNHLYMGPLAAFVARAIKAKLVIQLHGVEIWSAPSPMRRRALEAADLLWCVSRDTRARAITHADIAPERAIVVNNSVRPAFVPGSRAAARARFGVTNETALLSVGRLDPRERYKGHDRVISALPQLSREGRKCTYLIAGDGEDRSRLEALAQQLGVADLLRFLGNIDVAVLPDLYRAADIFVLPSTGEGFGIAFLEAMACGTPALGLSVGGATDALGDGELGTCVTEANFADALKQAFDLPRPDPSELAAAVHARFGRVALRERVAQAVSLLQ